MHPAYSVIIFTCASGAGYGLLILLAATALVAGPDGRIGLLHASAFTAAALLVTLGLLSSTAHLGRPERAWRALSQWRTSWLSREGVAAIATYVAGGLFAASWLWVDGGTPSILTRLLAAGTAISALATVWCTGMIYASLRTIRAWNHRLVAPLYVVLGLGTGALFFNAIKAAAGGSVTGRALWLALLLLVAGWIMKTIYWSSIDTARRSYTIGSATGLSALGHVRVLDPPHTQANFVMREMGFAVARRHALKLRGIAAVLLFVLPIALMLVLLWGAGAFAPVLAAVAAASASVGALTERWLFFAEAEHVSMLYYGRAAA